MLLCFDLKGETPGGARGGLECVSTGDDALAANSSEEAVPVGRPSLLPDIPTPEADVRRAPLPPPLEAYNEEAGWCEGGKKKAINEEIGNEPVAPVSICRHTWPRKEKRRRPVRQRMPRIMQC